MVLQRTQSNRQLRRRAPVLRKHAITVRRRRRDVTTMSAAKGVRGVTYHVSDLHCSTRKHHQPPETKSNRTLLYNLPLEKPAY